MSKSSVPKNTTDPNEGGKIAYMIYEHFRATEAYEAVQGLSDLFNIRLQNDDIQDFDVQWDQALLSTSDMPCDDILEGLYKSKLQDSVQFQFVLALYDQETVRNNGQTSYLRLKTSGNEIVERGVVTKSQKAKKAHVERKVGECFQWKAIGQCSKGDSCSFSHDRASGNRCDQRQEGQSSPLAPKAQAQTDGKKPSKSSGRREAESFWNKRKDSVPTFPCGQCTNPSCNFWHPPVCLNCKSESGCKYGDKCRFRHAEVDGLPSKKSKNSGVKDQLPY